MGGKAKTLKNQKSQSRKGREKGTKREGKGREGGGSPRRKLDVQNWNSNSSHVTKLWDCLCDSSPDLCWVGR